MTERSDRTLERGRAFSLLALALFGLLATRMMISDHAPDVRDALFTVCFAVIVVVALRLDRPLVLPAPFFTVTLVVVALLASVALSWHPLVSLLSVPAALCALAAFLAVTALGQAGRAPVLFALLTGAALSSAAAIVQRFVTWPDALRRKDELGLSATEVERLLHARPLGLSLSPDLMSALALVGIVAGIALFSSRKSSSGASPLEAALKPGSLVLVLLCLIALVLSRSAGGALALGVLLAAWAFIVVVRGLRGTLAMLALAGALAVPALLVALLGRGSEQLGRSAQERLENWQVGMSVLEGHLLSGVGFARFAPAYLAARSPEENVTRYAHSAFVQTLVEGGVVFGGAVLLVLVGGVLLLLRARLRSHADRSRDVVLAGVAALLARAAYDYDFQISATATSFAALLGVAWVDARRDGPVLSEAVLPVTARRRTLVATVVLATFFVVGLASAALGSHRDSVLEPFARGRTIEPEHVERLHAYADLFADDPHASTIEARLLLGALFACAHECDLALERARAFLEVERSHPPTDVFVLEAALAEKSGDHDVAQRALARAFEGDPGSPQAHRLRVRLARQAGDLRAAEYEREAERWRISERER